jgi:hypothetical protein
VAARYSALSGGKSCRRASAGTSAKSLFAGGGEQRGHVARAQVGVDSHKPTDVSQGDRVDGLGGVRSIGTVGVIGGHVVSQHSRAIPDGVVTYEVSRLVPCQLVVSNAHGGHVIQFRGSARPFIVSCMSEEEADSTCPPW